MESTYVYWIPVYELLESSDFDNVKGLPTILQAA